MATSNVTAPQGYINKSSAEQSLEMSASKYAVDPRTYSDKGTGHIDYGDDSKQFHCCRVFLHGPTDGKHILSILSRRLC